MKAGIARCSIMKAGIARRSITPPVGVDLTGYIGRPGPSARIHDDLFVTAAVLDDGVARIAIVTLDILGITLEQDAKLRNEMSSATGIPQENILTGCSHTHAGPAIQFLRHCGTPDDCYVKWAFTEAKSAVVDANAELSDAKLSLVKAESSMGMNRRNWVISSGKQASPTSGVITDSEVMALRIDAGDRTALFFNYACHGTTLGNQNVEVSADWIGAARSMVERETGITVGFLQGCCGNINPDTKGGFDEVKRLGEMVAQPLINALPNASALSEPEFKIAWTSVDLPYLPLPGQEELEMEISFLREEIEKMRAAGVAKHSIDINRAMLWWTEDALKMQEDDKAPASQTVRLQAISIGDVIFVAIPGECFCEIGLAIKKMANKAVIPVGYANGNIGYIPTAEAYGEGGYEPDNAYKYYGIQMIGPESEQIILSAIEELISQVN